MVGGVKQLLLMIAVVMGQSVLAADKKPLIADPIVEKAVRKQIKKPEGELTKADLEKVTGLNLHNKRLTDVKGLEKLTQLKGLHLHMNKLTSVKGLEKLTQLKWLRLWGNQLTNVKGLENQPRHLLQVRLGEFACGFVEFVANLSLNDLRRFLLG
jgi:hypothetical protein